MPESSSTDRTLLAETKDCPNGAAIEVTVGNRVIAIFNVDGEFSALDGICPHQGGPLGKGELTDSVVTCPWHQWQFDVKSGSCLLSAAIQQPQIPLEIDDGRIFARL